jgi:multisubunit Na+/H+ antiporter MnhE subunit
MGAAGQVGEVGRTVRVAVEVLVWWCVSVGVWLVSLSAYSGQDLAVAVACGLATAVMAVLTRRAVRADARPPAAVLRWLAVLPASILLDAVRVLALPWRPRARSAAGTFRRLPLGAPGDSPAAVGRRATAAVLLSSTPGAFVVDVDPGSGAALVHAVGPASPIERQVTR